MKAVEVEARKRALECELEGLSKDLMKDLTGKRNKKQKEHALYEDLTMIDVY